MNRGLEGIQKTGKCLGRGAKGAVFQGFDTESGRFVAIKEIALPPDEDGGMNVVAEQITNEVLLMQKAQHDNLVRYLGVQRDGANIQIYMEFISGGSVGSILKRQRRLREPVARCYAYDILQGLAYLHDVCRACHRDVKPENVLVTPEGRCKLADFGASRTLDHTTLMKTCTGTAFYMAPEVIEGNGYMRSADIWSFGVTVFEMVAGKPPFSHLDNAVAVMFQIVSATTPPSLPEDVTASEELRDLLNLCFTRDMNLRPSASDLLHHRWFSSMRGVSPGGVAPMHSSSAEHMTSDENGDGAGLLLDAGDRRLRCHGCARHALFTCDGCKSVDVMFNFCSSCWGHAHSHPRAAGHVKRPLLVTLSRPQDYGIMRPDGYFVDLCEGEQTGWTCGRCCYLNDGPRPDCEVCGNLR
jgi:serine/threonine protein kinase